MNFNGTKTRVLTITLAVICTLAPLSQTMAAGRYRSRTTNKRKVTNPSTSKVRRKTKPGLSDGEKVVVGVAALALLFWAVSESSTKTTTRRSYYSDSQRRAEQRRREELQRQRTINEMRTRRGY